MTAISPTTLDRLLGRPDCPVIVDVCVPEDQRELPLRLPGSLRIAHNDLAAMRACVGDRDSVIVCHKGLKLSQGVASALRAEGRRSAHLSGGIVAWRDAGLGLLRDDINRSSDAVWVGASNDLPTLVAAWVLRRFVSRSATLLLVEREQVQGVCDRFAGAPMPEPRAWFDPVPAALDATLSALDPLPPAILTCLSGCVNRAASDHQALQLAMPVLDAFFAGVTYPIEDAA